MHKLHALPIILVAFGLLPSGGMAQQPVRWEPTLENAQRAAAQSNRLVLIHFWAPWCGVCKQMEAEVLSQPTVAAELAANYVAVKVNADLFPATARQYGVSALPTTVIATPQGQALDVMRGRVEAPQYVARLGQVAADARRRAGAGMYAQVPPQNATVSTPQPAAPVTPGDRYSASANRGQPAMPPGPAIVPPVGAVATNMPPQGPAIAPPAFSAPPQQTLASPATAPMTGSPATPRNPSEPSPSADKPQQASTGTPPFGLDGFCSVTLCEKQKWEPGDRRWGAIHRGRTYLFMGSDEQRRFLADPDRYAPVISGNDVVAAIDQGQAVPGVREHGVYFGGRIYLFASEASLEQFSRNPNVYANHAAESLHAQNTAAR